MVARYHLAEVTARQHSGSIFTFAGSRYDILVLCMSSFSHTDRLGHLGSLFNRHGWRFQDMLHEHYQGVAKLHGLLGVSNYIAIYCKASPQFFAIARHVVRGWPQGPPSNRLQGSGNVRCFWLRAWVSGTTDFPQWSWPFSFSCEGWSDFLLDLHCSVLLVT